MKATDNYSKVIALRKLLGENWQEASLEEAEQAVAQTGPRYDE